MMKYIYEHTLWPKFTWDHEKIATLLGSVRNYQGRLLGKMESLGFSLQNEALLKTLTLEIVKSSEIEGELLDLEQVRSSIARQLGLNVSGLVSSDRHIDGVVEMMLDATQKFKDPLSQERLFAWHACLFPTGRSGMRQLTVGAWRKKETDPMQVVSGPIGRERVHYEAPSAERLPKEMKAFLKWFNQGNNYDAVLKAAIAHLWFVTIHPFEDGNGRIARAIADMQLARSDESSQRFYSMSVQIRKERKEYYKVLERIQSLAFQDQSVINKGIDITVWLEWFFACLNRSLENTEDTLADVLEKARFWEKHKSSDLNQRQTKVLNKLLEGFEGHLTTSKWAKMNKCSQDTAHRDIIDLIKKKVLKKDSAGGRSTHYVLR
jgi:Fic family protein